MAKTVDEIVEEVSKLSREDRIDFLRELLYSLEDSKEYGTWAKIALKELEENEY